jgi:hypothetical protein
MRYGVGIRVEDTLLVENNSGERERHLPAGRVVSARLTGAISIGEKTAKGPCCKMGAVCGAAAALATNLDHESSVMVMLR